MWEEGGGGAVALSHLPLAPSTLSASRCMHSGLAATTTPPHPLCSILDLLLEA